MNEPTEQDLILARTLLVRYKVGILSTISQNSLIKDYPFGSVVPYALDKDNQIIIYVTELAEHSKNIRVNPRVALTIIEDMEGNTQAKSRLTYIGNAKKIEFQELEEIEALYFKKHPQTREYKKYMDFSFYRIEFKIIRFIVGFGNILWITPDHLEKEL